MPIKVYKYIFSGFVLSVLLLFAYCKKADERQCLKSNGPEIEVFRSFENFEKIILKDNIHLSIEKDTINALILNVPENLASFIVTDINNNILTIENTNKCNWIRSFKTNIHATVKTTSLKNLECRGSGNVNNKGQIAQDYFEVNLHDASGSINLLLSTKETAIKMHNGPATVSISGSTENLSIYNAGTGFILLQNFDSKSSVVKHKGTGVCHVKASHYLNARIEYVGDIHYYGNPIEKKLEKIGSGNFVKH